MDIVISTGSFQYLENSCAICLLYFEREQYVDLIIHSTPANKKESIDIAKKKLHMFHSDCMAQYSKDVCPLDRIKIHKISQYKYCHLICLNLTTYSTDYNLLISNKPDCISIIDIDNLNFKDNNGKTLFYCACSYGDSELQLIKKLIKYNASIIIPNNHGFTPLMVAISGDFIEVTKIIVKNLISTNIFISHICKADDSANTLFDYAIINQSWQSLYYVLDKINKKDITSNVEVYLKNLYKKIKYINNEYVRILVVLLNDKL